MVVVRDASHDNADGGSVATMIAVEKSKKMSRKIKEKLGFFVPIKNSNNGCQNQVLVVDEEGQDSEKDFYLISSDVWIRFWWSW